MTSARISVLVEHLVPMLSAEQPGLHLPALETIFSRGTFQQGNFNDADELRFTLFGLEPRESLPIGALTRLGDLRGNSPGNVYCLRADPVTLRADMARVVMTSHGFGDLDALERKEIEHVIRTVLHEEGMELGSDHSEHWTIALQHPLKFNFTSLNKALGMDVAEALPDHPEALPWRRILNEIQMALHACPVNIRRRQQGRSEINSVWFWGGGYLPVPPIPQPFSAVYSNHPVSTGLALLNDCALIQPGVENGVAGGDLAISATANILFDWAPQPDTADIQVKQLESLAAQLLVWVRQGRVVVELYAADGSCWTFNRYHFLKAWRRCIPVYQHFLAAGNP